MRRNFSESSEIQRFFPPKLRWSPRKKRSSPKLRLIFRPKSEIQRFFPPKIRWSPKKNKVFTEIETDFSSEIQNSKVFSAQNQVVSKKKIRSSPKFSQIFRSNSEIQTFEGAVFLWGGLFSIFHKKSASKAPKTCDFAYFTSQWGGLDPPPPWLRYCPRPMYVTCLVAPVNSARRLNKMFLIKFVF